MRRSVRCHIVAAASDHGPTVLVEQLKPDGRMVPVGGARDQTLKVITKEPMGQ